MGGHINLNKKNIKKISYSGLVADLFHYGHLHSIEFAKSISDYNICGVLTDDAVEKYRTKPIASYEERKAVISNLKSVDRVMIQHNRNPTENLKIIHKEFPNAEIILVHGDDLEYVDGSDFIKKIGGQVVKHPYYKKLSTFKIIDKIVENKNKFKDIRDFSSYFGREEDFLKESKNKTIISTKANTLASLQPYLKKSKIEKMYVLTVPDWKNRKNEIINKVKQEFLPHKIVVRSSAVIEDTFDNSMAGHFKSVIDVDSTNIKEIESAINKVYNSYKQKDSESSFNQILIQSQTRDIVISGVVFTRSLDESAPYYIINYDDSTGQSDTVTKGVENKTIKISHFADKKLIPKNLRNLMESINEIENIIPKIGLDIEFAINKKGETIIFQVRPIITSLKAENKDWEIKNRVTQLKKQFSILSEKKPHLSGQKNIFADMPDWNPAEIIGNNPNYLDFTLYDYIITNEAWHEARTSQGYYNVNPAKLVVLFGNKPYVDVRNTFNSFIPASVTKSLHKKLMSFYLDKLEKHPEMQDKVEFEILFSCYDLCFEERSKELISCGFSKDEINQFKKSLINLTNNLIINFKTLIKEDLGSVKIMEKNRNEIKNKISSKEASVRGLLDYAKILLDDCRKNGTVQFSRLARLAFIGKIIFKSIINKNLVDEDVYDDFMNSVKTVATELNQDFIDLSLKKINLNDFIKKYYHLRPGSYDITALRYESNPQLIHPFDSKVTLSKYGEFKLNNKTMEKINSAFKENSLECNAQEFLDFVKAALESREFSKFEFSKNLSDALELIALAGEKMGFTRQELAILNINEIFSDGEKDRNKITDKWRNIISKRIEEREINKKIILPSIIYSEKDFEVIHPYIPRPNYITQKKIFGKIIKLKSFEEEAIKKIEGNIVMIENADPGYDWIFTRKPAGLITKYGGVASHMSIRCAEFGIPAAIGCGELFDQIDETDSILLDCKLRKMTSTGG